MTYHFDYLNNQVNSFINSLVNQTNFDLNTFEAWIEDNNIKNKNNPNTYVLKIFKQELEKGTFKKSSTPTVYYIPTMQPLFNDMREKGILVTEDGSSYVEVLTTYILKNHLKTGEELSVINHRAVSEVEVLENPTIKDFIKALKKELKDLPIDYKAVDEEYRSIEKEWNKIIKELEGLK